MDRPRRHEIEIVVAIGSVALLLMLVQIGARLTTWAGTIAFIAVLLLVAQPYALLRLLEHFRPVPPRVLWAAVGLAGAGLLALIVLPYPRPPALLITAAVCFAAAQGYAARAFITEAGLRVGVTQWRLWLAFAGTALAVVFVLAEGVAWWFGARLGTPLFALLSLVLVACYWLGLAPPRRVLRAAQQREFIRLLHQTAERAPHEREDHLADDLNTAAMRAVTAASTAVLLGRDGLTVYASSEPTWAQLRVTPAMGLVGIALGGVEPVVGPRDECERPLNQLAEGDIVVVIPIARSSPGWGALVVVQRRASVLLPEDLSLVGRLCRHAADVLDHARLLHEERTRARVVGL